MRGVKLHVSNKVNEGCKLSGDVRKIMKNKRICMEIKRKLYKKILDPIVLYRSELKNLRNAENQ